MPAERWTTSPRAVAALDAAQAAVRDAVDVTGRRLASRRMLPVWAVRILLEELAADLDDEE